MENRKVTLKTIAEELGISVMTVSRVFNKHPYVREEIREKVLKLAEKLNYYPNFVARSLVKKKTNTIGFIIPSIHLSFFAEITKGIEETLNQKGYKLILCHSNEDFKKEKEEINILKARQIDGLIIAPAKNVEKFLHYILLKKSGIPFVLVDRYFPKIKISYVATDDEKGAEEMTDFLINLGHRKIGYLAGPQEASDGKNRLKGYIKSLKKYGIPIARKMIRITGINYEDGYREMNYFLNMREKPTAIFAFNDDVAFGAFHRIREKNLDIPKDITLVGFGNEKGGAILTPPLTTMDQMPYEIGKKSAEILINKIEKKERKEVQVLLKPKLVIRKSHC